MHKRNITIWTQVSLILTGIIVFILIQPLPHDVPISTQPTATPSPSPLMPSILGFFHSPWMLLFYTILLIYFGYRTYVCYQIKQASKRYQAINALNQTMTFQKEGHHTKSYSLNREFNTRAQFENFNLSKRLKTNIRHQRPEIMIFHDTFDSVLENHEQMQHKYRPQLRKIQRQIEPLNDIKFAFDWYVERLEDKLCKHAIPKKGQANKFAIKCKYEYTTPAGRNHYQHAQWITGSEYQHLCYLAVGTIRHTQRDHQHNWHSSNSHYAKVQRQLLTPKLRYQILQRDDFTCQLCGRKQSDGVKLHVDHIKPVALGGTTTPDNLRTLCETCNLGKGSDYQNEAHN